MIKKPKKKYGKPNGYITAIYDKNSDSNHSFSIIDSNEYKEYFGVSKELISKYTVYSKEVACDMAKQITNIAKSDYGIGITGQLGIKDTANNSENINTVYISIYDGLENNYNTYEIEAKGNKRIDKKIYIVNFIKERLYEICK